MSQHFAIIQDDEGDNIVGWTKFTIKLFFMEHSIKSIIWKMPLLKMNNNLVHEPWKRYWNQQRPPTCECVYVHHTKDLGLQSVLLNGRCPCHQTVWKGEHFPCVAFISVVSVDITRVLRKWFRALYNIKAKRTVYLYSCLKTQQIKRNTQKCFLKI